LPASLVPKLCADLPINWFVTSDGCSRCKKGERFLSLLCSLGIIKLIKSKRWCGPGHPHNRAATYGLPQDKTICDLGRRWYEACQDLPESQERKRESIYITDNSAFTNQDITEFILEVERLNRSRKPQYHDSG